MEDVPTSAPTQLEVFNAVVEQDFPCKEMEERAQVLTLTLS